MDLQVLFYIIVAIVFIVGKLLKKSEEAPGPSGSEPQRPVRKFQSPGTNPTSVPQQKQLTFEELLREIQQSKAPAPARQQSIPAATSYVDYDDNIAEEEQDLEKTDYNYRKKDSVSDVYEESKKQAFNRPSLEETMKVGDTVMSFGRFKSFEQESKRDFLGEYLAELRDPEGFKKAVVMNEILQRKF